jgi:hypothetical protein
MEEIIFEQEGLTPQERYYIEQLEKTCDDLFQNSREELREFVLSTLSQLQDVKEGCR